jgi:ectoine hydroxylase-related dioxygenase (phytanoyl-CoA dioxygenase family)
MHTLDITREEIESSRMMTAHLDAAVEAIRTDGYVVLNDVVDPAHIASLRERMLADVPQILADAEPPYNFNRGNIQQDPPPFHPYLFRDVLLNDMVIAVTRGVLGPGLKNSFYSGNTALPGNYTQPVHLDTAHLWPDMPVATPAFSLVVNVPVVDMTPENGAIQLWPGSHLDTSVSTRSQDNRVPDALVAKRRDTVPPLQPSMRMGSVLIRDMRLWHNGMPNHTTSARPMIAMIHWIHWWHERESIPFARGTEAFFTHPDLKTNAMFVAEPVDYIHRNADQRRERRAARRMG